MLTTLAGLGIAGYLSVVRALGENAVCGPSQGCEIVASSRYSAIFGVPVAYLGVGISLVLVACAVTWWRRADRRALLVAYGLLLLSTLFAAYLTYLELFEIHAICPWCVSFAIAIVVSLVIAGLAMSRSSREAEADHS